MARTATPAQKQAAADRREKFRAMARVVADMGEDQRLALAAKIGVVNCEGRPLSPFNSCLIWHQRPTASMVGGFRQWLKAGRAVRKGEHGAMIWVPIGKKKSDGSDEQADKPGFIAGTVFDISQTDEIGGAE